jgi:4-hydroxyphenylpyruvate dioxygenase
MPEDAMEDAAMMPARLPKSIATVCLSGTLTDKLEAAAAIGFDGVEIFENDLLTFAGSLQEARQIAEGLGLAITLFQPFRDFEAMPDPQRARNLDRAERKFDVMQALGTDLLLVCSNVQPAAIDDDGRAAADLAEMAERAGRRGLRVGYEALAWGRHVNRWGRAWEIVRRAGHPALGLIVDSFHTLALEDDYAGLAKVPADKLFFVQLADAPRLNMDPLSWGRHFRKFPGQGELDLVGFTRAVLASGYRGPLSLEVFNDEFRAASARMTARDGLRSLLFVESEAGGPALPPPPQLDGFEFLEFAVDELSGAELAAFLTRLGFRHVGVHRSKAVRLFRRGGANLVVNAEPDSAAAEHFHLHGPSVCAMGFRVDDTARALERAEALLYPEWREPTGVGERSLPAVRAPDGTLVCLIEAASEAGSSGPSIWDDDFHLAAEAATEDEVIGIDHVAQALPADRLDSFMLFYRSVLGLAPQPLWELPDPYGLIRSRALVSRNSRVRLPLNVSESSSTATGRFVAYAGAGVHHIALATSDLRRTVLRLRANEAGTLPIPPNYYDDLAARWDLDATEVAALRELDMLYDRDDAGEFRHAYTPAFDDRFFFELVERRGYQGFGAANAGMRIAAQAQQRGVQADVYY